MWLQGNSRKRLSADTEVLFPADIYLCLGIPSWREEVTTNRRNLHWPLYANLTFLHLPGGKHLFTLWLAKLAEAANLSRIQRRSKECGS